MMFELNSGKWSLAAAPECGGNLARAAWQGIDIMRPFETMEQWQNTPTNFGFAVLFPPNRIDNGKFTFQGKEYFLPVNEPARCNHLHGIALREKWTCTECAGNKIAMELIFDQNSPMYEGYPFDCSLRVEYTVNEDELTQRFEVENHSAIPIPCALGFHSAFVIPERMKVYGSGKKIELMPPRYLATGNEVDWEDDFAPSKWCDPVKTWPFGHLRATESPLAELDYNGYLVSYMPDPEFKYWMVWRPVDDTSFICIEPMNMRIGTFETAPDLLPITQPGETSSFISRIKIKKNQ